MYKNLSDRQIVATIETLSQRINERFPDAGLGRVCEELLGVAKKSSERCKEICKPNIGLRVALVVVAATLLLLVFKLFTMVRVSHEDFELSQFVQSFEAFLASFVYLGATGIFLVSVETRLKRRRALEALHEMRSLAHIVDMHQLTKAPEVLAFAVSPTRSSPKRLMSAFEMSRYFDYCSEMLSLISKVAALYIQNFPDPAAMEAVDQIEDLTTGLSQKIWQKTALLQKI